VLVEALPQVGCCLQLVPQPPGHPLGDPRSVPRCPDPPVLNRPELRLELRRLADHRHPAGITASGGNGCPVARARTCTEAKMNSQQTPASHSSRSAAVSPAGHRVSASTLPPSTSSSQNEVSSLAL
jgi:hypothetical protein